METALWDSANFEETTLENFQGSYIAGIYYTQTKRKWVGGKMDTLNISQKF
jgi:trehalose/maltose hydrolase-like predicted phosphorylase